MPNIEVILSAPINDEFNFIVMTHLGVGPFVVNRHTSVQEIYALVNAEVKKQQAEKEAWYVAQGLGKGGLISSDLLSPRTPTGLDVARQEFTTTADRKLDDEIPF